MSMAVGDKKGSAIADINVTPMADIMIVLLIIFMVITPLINKGVDVELPKAANTKERKDEQDKDPADLKDFAALQAEALSMGQDWALVFAAAMSGQGRQAPASTQVEAALTRMVEAVKSGNLSGMIPFDRQGEAVQLG